MVQLGPFNSFNLTVKSGFYILLTKVRLVMGQPIRSASVMCNGPPTGSVVGFCRQSAVLKKSAKNTSEQEQEVEEQDRRTKNPVEAHIPPDLKMMVQL